MRQQVITLRAGEFKLKIRYRHRDFCSRIEMQTLPFRLSNAAQVTGLTVFGRSDDPTSAVHVRSFAPAQGIPEDPVCGSGNASVAAFLVHSGLPKRLGSRYVARQGAGNPHLLS